MAAPWGRVGVRACALFRSKQVERLAGSCNGDGSFGAASSFNGYRPKQLQKGLEDAPSHIDSARITQNERLKRRGFSLRSGESCQLDDLADNDGCCFGGRYLVQARHYSGQAAELRESLERADSDVRERGIRHLGASDISAPTRRGRFEHCSSSGDDVSQSAKSNADRGNAQQRGQKVFHEAVPIPKFQAHLKNPKLAAKVPGWSQPLANVSFQSPVPDAFSVRAFLETHHRVDSKTGTYVIQLAPNRDGSERGQRSRRKGRSFDSGEAESSGFSGRGAAPLDRRKGSSKEELERGERGRSAEELEWGEREGVPVRGSGQGDRRGRSVEELERGGQQGGPLGELEREHGAGQGDSYRVEDRMHERQGDRRANAESAARSGLSGQKTRLANQADPDDGEFEEHSLDVLAQAEAEALLESLRGLPSAAAAGEELRSKVGQGLLDWSHVDKLCRTLLPSENPRDEELLLAGLSVACGMEMSGRETVKKWALVSFIIRRLVKTGRIAAAKRVPSSWSDGQATSRALARKVLTTALMKADALRDAGEVFEAALAAGLLIRELTPVGKQLVAKLILTKQFRQAMQLTLALGKAGEYAPFVEVIGALTDEQMFLEAFYILDVYSKAVDKPDSKLLVKIATQYAEHGYEQTGLEFLAVLQKAGAAPHPVLFKVLARAYTLAKLPALVEKVNEARGDCVGESDTRFPIALVNAYLDSGDVSKAGGLCAAAIAKRLTARDREIGQTLQRLLAAHAAAGNVPEGWEVLRWLDARGASYHIDLLTPLFEAVLRESGSDVTRLMDAFEAHRRHLAGRKAATWLHKSLFQFLTSKGLLEDAVSVFEAGVQDGVSVPLTNTIRLIFDLIEAGHPTVALGVLRRAPEMEREYPKLFYKLTDRLGERKEFLPFE